MHRSTWKQKNKTKQNTHSTNFGDLSRASSSTFTIFQPIKLKLQHENEIMVGSDLDIEMQIINQSDSPQLVLWGSLQVAPKTYTGEQGPFFTSVKLDKQVVEPGQGMQGTTPIIYYNS